MLSIDVQGSHFNISVSDLQKDVFVFENQSIKPDIIKTGNNRFNLIWKNQSVELELVKQEGGKFLIKVNGKPVETTLKTRLDLLLESMGLNAAVSTRLTELKAPMPGLILDIKVQAGQTVQKGEPLLVLEAMKMENVIKATGDGTVKEIKVLIGEKVEKNQVLLKF